MANWVKCKVYGSDSDIVVNLEQVVSLSGDDRATVVRCAGGSPAEFVVTGSPQQLLGEAMVRDARATRT